MEMKTEKKYINNSLVNRTISIRFFFGEGWGISLVVFQLNVQKFPQPSSQFSHCTFRISHCAFRLHFAYFAQLCLLQPAVTVSSGNIFIVQKLILGNLIILNEFQIEIISSGNHRSQCSFTCEVSEAKAKAKQNKFSGQYCLLYEKQ